MTTATMLVRVLQLALSEPIEFRRRRTWPCRKRMRFWICSLVLRELNDMVTTPPMAAGASVISRTFRVRERILPSGRYQMTAATFGDAQEALGLDDFSPRSQDLAAAWLLHQKAILPYLKIGDFAGALDPASRVWSSLPKGEGSWNIGRYDNAKYLFQKAHDFADVQSFYNDALASRQDSLVPKQDDDD